MGILYFVRHGETDWNRDGRIQGQSDPPLNETGRIQAGALAGVLAPVAFDVAFSSDLQRAYETASILLRGRQVAICATEGLRERNFGSWEGRSVPELWVEGLLPDQSWPGAAAPPGGESADDLHQRVIRVVTRIAASHREATILVVSHGGVIRSALVDWVGVDPPFIANCAVYVVGVEEFVPRLIGQLGVDIEP